MSSKNNEPPSSAAPANTVSASRSSSSSISNNAPSQRYQPQAPSTLRQAHMPPSSPEDRHQHGAHTHGRAPEIASDGAHPYVTEDDIQQTDFAATYVRGDIEEPSENQVDAKGWLRYYGHKYNMPECGDDDCNHGTFSPQPRHMRGYGSFVTSDNVSERSRDGYGGPIQGGEDGQVGGAVYRGDFIDRSLGDAVTDGLLGHPSKKSTTHWLAKRHGVRHERLMYAHTLSHITSASCFETWRPSSQC